MSAPARQLSRHITSDGRQSLRKHLFGPRPNGLPKHPFRAELAPLFTAVGGAVVLGGWFAQRHLFNSPNVHVNKMDRKSTIKKTDDKAQRFVTHRGSMRNMANYVEKN